MIESGLYLFATQNTALQALLGQSAQEKNTNAWSSFYFSFLPKEPGGILPGIILDRLLTEEEDDTLDSRSAAAPWTPLEARFQFGCVANDSTANPANASGYLSAALLAQALRRQLMGLATGNAILPDGTLIQNVEFLDEYDAHFEVGGVSYLFRRVLQVKIRYQETK